MAQPQSPGILSFLDYGGVIIDLGDGRGGSVTRDANGNVAVRVQQKPQSSQGNPNADGGTSGVGTGPAWMRSAWGPYAVAGLVAGILFFVLGGLSR